MYQKFYQSAECSLVLSVDTVQIPADSRDIPADWQGFVEAGMAVHQQCRLAGKVGSRQQAC